jgi:hypothetical protein
MITGCERNQNIPHWPYSGAPVPVDALLVVVAAFEVEVLALDVVAVACTVVDVEPPFELPVLMTTLYALTLNTALEPVKGSVPAPILVTY